MQSVEHIAGAELLLAVFGRWPSFHDAEVISLQFDRRAIGDDRPALETLVHTFELTNDVDADGLLVLRNHVLVRFRFREVVVLKLESFNHQNALMGIRIFDVRERQLERIKYEVHFDAAHGLDAVFQCHSIEVVSVVSCDRSGEPLAG